MQNTHTIIHDIEAPDERAGIELENILEHAQHTPVLLLTSGGSAMSLLEHVSPVVLGSYLTIAVLDERYSEDPEINNFAQLKETRFYKSAKEAGCSFIDTTVQVGEDISGLTERFEHALRGWRNDNPDGVVIATLGIGTDGHVAGMMPYPKDEDIFITQFNGPAWVIGYDAGDKNKYPMRVTVTNTFLAEEVQSVLVFARGEEKAEILTQVLSAPGPSHELPAYILHDLKNVTVVTDCEIE
ncbi:hypothetical protein COB55_01270 [Candidatus Wolfebacteria bacterium]|nr:MAG: hypothetical protein COB55_01270 [Candidatus Wolfebacteria bacterium]